MTAAARPRPVLTAFVVALGLLLTAPAVDAAGGFGSPFMVAAPVAQDLAPAQLAISPTGGQALAYGISDEDNPAAATGRLALGTVGRRFGAARTVPASQGVLALAYQGSTLDLLLGDSPRGNACCSSVTAASVAGGAVGTRRVILKGLTGTVQAELVPVQKEMLAAIATEHGVWVAQAGATGHFGPTRPLNIARAWPQAVAATALANGTTIVVWTARTTQFAPGPAMIDLATGNATSAPSHPHVTFGAASGHTIDELGLAAHGDVPTTAWIESFTDGAGAVHSTVYVQDLTSHRVAPQALSAVGAQASGLAFASGANGTEAIAFRTCTADGMCTLHAAVRHGARFGSVRSLGAIDATADPVVSVSASGAVIVGWIDNGSVLTASAGAAAASFTAPATVSATAFASGLTLTFAPTGRDAVAAWTQGTLNQSIVAAAFGTGTSQSGGGVAPGTGGAPAPGTGATGASGASGVSGPSGVSGTSGTSGVPTAQ